ncbi:MAG: hypothetical protein LBV30_01650 [Propionibacteriaceae bacterium]|jgi:hypothetical protein|nr:hypothetical protein [Propionibacteriaceae bacterium]
MAVAVTGLVLQFAIVVEASADGANCSVAADTTTKHGLDIALSCSTSTPGATAGSGSASGAASSERECRLAGGGVVDCWLDGRAWLDEFQSYCSVRQLADDSPLWLGHRREGFGDDTPYSCAWWSYLADGDVYWVEGVLSTPVRPQVDARVLADRAVASIGLHAPTVNASAYVYDQWPDQGVMWWVGAPMWFWIDAGDRLQYGRHQASVTVDGVTLSVEVSFQSVTFNSGLDEGSVTCTSPFDVRSRDSLLRDHAPSGCEYTYMVTSDLDDAGDRFQLSGFSDWLVEWTSSDNQSGQFDYRTPVSDGPAVRVNELHVVETDPNKI